MSTAAFLGGHLPNAKKNKAYHTAGLLLPSVGDAFYKNEKSTSAARNFALWLLTNPPPFDFHLHTPSKGGVGEMVVAPQVLPRRADHGNVMTPHARAKHRRTSRDPERAQTCSGQRWRSLPLPSSYPKRPTSPWPRPAPPRRSNAHAKQTKARGETTK